jgi:protein involved in polysaccharide export with SLBB domain
LPPDSPELAESYAMLPSANGKAHGLLPGQKVNGQANHSLAKSVLSSPMEVTEQLTGEDPQPMVHIPLPGWVWNLERRKQWQTALHEWRQIENIVILVELPPASEPEAVLLAQNLPNLIWLSDTGVVHAGPTREHLQTLRDARCNLVGSVVNHAPKAAFKDRFSRWTGCLALCLIAFSALNGRAATAEEVLAQALGRLTNTAAPPGPAVAPVATPAAETTRIETNLAFSAFRSDRRAGWQQRFTLGPGDVLNFALFGQPEFNRAEVPVGPDGRVSYLQAQDLMAAGLTIDELRARMDQELGKFYRSPHTIITPFAYNSKKYFVLGKVVNAGAFSLDHPVSVVEAVARAHGLQTGVLDNQNSVDLVDLQKSFLMRGGKRITVDLEKLFQHGDLSQNVALEPNDYLYFAPGALREVYVLGEVRNPGPLVQTDTTTVVGAIASRGGFTDRAYKSKVLVVRGSLNAPQTFVVDTLATVDARALDFKLQPKDIVYVSWRPFIKVEELLDLAATAFIQSTVAAWAGQNIGPFIASPILPSL